MLLKVHCRTGMRPKVASGLVGQCRIDKLACAKSLGKGRGLAGLQRLQKGLPLLKFVAYH